MMNFLLAGLGGMLGSMARYALAVLLVPHIPLALPMGTLCANLLGCLLAGLFAGMADSAGLITPEMRIFLVTGFCGGLTTFSGFSTEILNLARTGHDTAAFVYAAGSLLLGLGAALLGGLLAQAGHSA